MAVFGKFFFAAFLVFALACCAQPAPPRTDMALGTVCSINLFEKGTEERYDALFNRLDDIEALMSANLKDSTIGKINAAAGIRPVKSDRETMQVLQTALHFASDSGGRFDPTIGPLVKLWDIGGPKPTVPEPEEINKARSLIDWRRIVINTEESTIFLPAEGMRIDLGAIAKGYAADELATMIRRWGIKRAMIDLGGNIFALGSKTEGTPWHIGIRNPEQTGGAPVLSLYVSDKSMVTSGIYERFFIENGTHYHHILDPETGSPANSDIFSVSIISPRSIEADALSTTLFLLGIQKGLKYIESIPDTEAVFIDTSRKVYGSSGVAGEIRIIDPDYTLANNQTITTELSQFP